MYKTKPTQKLHKSISDYFEQISRKTVINAYKKSPYKMGFYPNLSFYELIKNLQM